MIRLRTAVPVLILALWAVQAHAQPCTPGVLGQVQCEDFDDCTVDVCDPIALACTHSPAPDDTSCSDGNECTDGDTCQSGACRSGTPIDGCGCQQNDDCDDGDPCTDDVCGDLGQCESKSGGDGNACDDGDACTTNDRCSDGTCSGTFLTCDDGIACTDDSCEDGQCTHDPDDDLCTASNECSIPQCKPDDPAADVQGCVATSGSLEATACSEDTDPCTVDRCRAGVCAHDPIADPTGCRPLVPSYQRAVILRSGVARLENYISNEADVGGDTSSDLTDQLDAVAADLSATILVLAGRDPASGVTSALPASLGGRPQQTAVTTAQQRGRVALAWIRDTPAHVQDFLGIVARGRRKDDLDATTARELRRNGHILLADTKALKRDVKNLQKTFSVFQR